MLIPRAGEQLGDFELIRRVGAGGMGVVFEARQQATGRRMALKILSPAMTREKNRRRFLREAEAAARLNHPNIVAVYAVRDDPDVCYYAMEFVDGWPLSRVLERLGAIPPATLPLTEIMRTNAADGEDLSAAKTVIEEIGASADTAAEEKAEGESPAQRSTGWKPVPQQSSGWKPAPPQDSGLRTQDSGLQQQSTGWKPVPQAGSFYVRQIAIMMRDIARALHYAHEHGVTHRDIKPDNLLLDHDGKLHLVDFGLARILEEDNITLTGELMGTPLYMSPEQVAAGRIGIDHRTDIYSLGVVMYHLLCLQPPYEAPTREALLRAIVIHQPPPLSARNPAVPVQLEAIVHHAMEKDPDRRYATGSHLADDLDRWLAGQPISLPTPGPLRRWWRRSSTRTRRAFFAAASMLVLAAVTVPIIRWWPGDQGTTDAVREAAQEADRGDYFRAALWYAAALQQRPSMDDEATLRAAVYLRELPALRRRFALADAGRSWDLDPMRPALTLAGADDRWHSWNLAADTRTGLPFGLSLRPVWLACDPSGAGVWTIEAGTSGQSMALWSPRGEPISSRPLTWPDPALQIRTGSLPPEFTAAVMTAARPRPGAAPAADPGSNVGVYRFTPGSAPEFLMRTQTDQPVELAPDGRAMVALTHGSGLVEFTSLARKPPLWRPPYGINAVIGAVSFSPDGKRLAIAESTGEISVRDPPTGSPLVVPTLAPSVNLRSRTAPEYLKFSADGRWLLTVGSESQASPPFLRSIELIDTVSSSIAYAGLGRDAFFAGRGRVLIWWDDAEVVVVGLPPSRPQAPETDTSDPRPRDLWRVRVPVHGRFARPEGIPSMDTADAAWSPVWADADARRLLCAEASDGAGRPTASLSIWDISARERIWRATAPAAEFLSVGLDPAGRFGMAQLAGSPARLAVWDLGDPADPYPRSAALPVAPVSFDHLALTRGPQIAVFSQEQGRSGWSLIDPARPLAALAPLPARGSPETWLVSEDSSTLLELAGGRLLMREFATGRDIYSGPLPGDARDVTALSADGRRLALRLPDRRLSVSSIPQTGPAVDLGTIPLEPARARFSPTGRLLAVMDVSGRIVVYSVATAAPIMDVQSGGRGGEMQFALDESLLVAGHVGGAASVWAIARGQRVGRIDAHGGGGPGDAEAVASLVTHIAVQEGPAASSALLATAVGNRVRLWRLAGGAANGEDSPLPSAGPALSTTQGIIAVAFSSCASANRPASQPAGEAGESDEACQRLLAITDRPAIRWFDLSMPKRSPEEWRTRLLERAGAQLDASGTAVLHPVRADTALRHNTATRPSAPTQQP